MGTASVANRTDDPCAAMVNPAQLGMMSQTNFFSSGYNSSDWLPSFQITDLKYSTYAVNAGISLDRIFEHAPPVSIGIGYSRVHLNLGTFILVSEMGPDEIGRYDAWESSDQYSLGVGYDFGINVSAGITVKYVHSNLAPLHPGGIAVPQESPTIWMPNLNQFGKATLYDYGLLVSVPIVKIVSGISNESFDIGPGVAPYADMTFGLSRSNLGQASISYQFTPQGDLLPRTARTGLGFDMGLRVNRGDLLWTPLSFKWTIEASDLLIDNQRQYQSGIGDINFFDEVVLGKTNAETMKGKGWEVNFMEIGAIRRGVFVEDPHHGDRHFTSWGWGIKFSGIPRLLRVLDVPIPTTGAIGFIINHIDISYNRSEWSTSDRSSPLDGTIFNSINLRIMN
ncbi:MAG TPA: hypothetical protein VK470_08190 [Bacteroidota bacterium]|nr:hypothetical protein [Bacteroidota bacterium]